MSDLKLKTGANNNFFVSLKYKWRFSGLQQIDAALRQVEVQLQSPNISTLDWLIITGRRRELLAARWVVNKLLSEPDLTPEIIEELKIEDKENQAIVVFNSPPDNSLLTTSLNSNLSFRSQFYRTWEKLNSELENLTDYPLEIDILRHEKKQELFSLLFVKFETILEELRFAEIQPNQLFEKKITILTDLWQDTTTDFFGKYYTLQIADREIELVKYLLQDESIVKEFIFNKIPLIEDLLEYLLFHHSLSINNTLYNFGTYESTIRAEILLENMLIEIGNSVVQPLLNNFADIDKIKNIFYDQKLLSSRQIARFRNDLSWKYRLKEYVLEPTEVFESKYSLLVFDDLGIKKISIYAPRSHQLAQLEGIQLIVTLTLEIKDAIAPRLQSIVTFIGKGVVYLLTQIVGRGIGLIGRGILQGIGNSIQENKYGKNNNPK